MILPLYSLAWTFARPFLRRSPRVSLGWEQRILQEAPEGPFDIWIQAASGGESLLTNMVIERLAASLPQHKRLRVLATSGTKQGVDSLQKGRSMLGTGANIEISIAYFPFDAPRLMHKAFATFAPKLAIIVETELWPGFLIAARNTHVPVFLINGRMSEKSYGFYRHFCSFFKKYGPEKIWAISTLDRDRFAGITGVERVELMNNIKFDRIEPKTDFPTNTAIADFLPQGSPFVLLGSVRREEEAMIMETITALLKRRGDIVIGLFPKHIERADPVVAQLQAAGIAAVKRSCITEKRSPGTVIVWDVFGELAGAYALAKATFVGGSLVNLGGQNFLEPLVFGLKPITGPYWKNFAWVGREIVTSGLVQEVADVKALTDGLLAAIDDGTERAEVIESVRLFILPRKGGSALISRHILEKLHLLEQ